MIIRPAETRDAPALAGLWNALIRDTLATFTTDEKLYADLEVLISQRSQTCWVAEDNKGAFAGFVTYGPFRSGPGYAATIEHTIMLDRRAQGQGVVLALMDTAQAAAHAQGCHIMVAGISSANPAAVRFHTALGFQQTGHLRQVGRKNDQWLDLILMQKTLSSP